MFWILAKTKSSHILFYLHYMFTGFPLKSYQIPAKLTPLFFIKASNVETSWLKRCWLILREADVQTFQQKPNVPHHLHSGAALQAFSSFPGHFLAQLDLVLALQSPCTFCSELAEASTCSEWSWMAASWRECLSKIASKLTGWDWWSSMIGTQILQRYVVDYGPWMLSWLIIFNAICSLLRILDTHKLQHLFLWGVIWQRHSGRKATATTKKSTVQTARSAQESDNGDNGANFQGQEAILNQKLWEHKPGSESWIRWPSGLVIPWAWRSCGGLCWSLLNISHLMADPLQ